jgi:hypothetical protein
VVTINKLMSPLATGRGLPVIASLAERGSGS